MSKRSKSLWTASTPCATPESAEPKRVTVEIHTLATDRRAAELFWRMYIFQKTRADRNEAKLRRVEDCFKRFKMRAMAKKLKAGPLDRPARKGRGL